jgi:DNA-binding CsgD family transcriptional regulator
MTAPRSAELRRALAFVEDLHTAPTVHDLRLLVGSELPEVIGCDYAGLDAHGPRCRYELELELPGTRLRIGRHRRDFTSNAREVLELLRPHLVEALQAARQRETVGGRLEAVIDRETLAARGLTEREVEVLELVACGCTNKQLGLRLGISPRTVQKHLERIHSKLGVSTRTAAVAVAIGVISDVLPL